LLTDDQDRRFKFGLAAPALRGYPVALVLLAVSFFTAPVLYNVPVVVFVSFVGWAVTLGALGSMAFILVNALGIEVDATIDVTNRDLIMFRILLGTLFSVVLTLPVVFQSYENFFSGLFVVKGNTDSTSINIQQAIVLLLPFLFGFSTSLVLTILNRLMESVQTFFGVSAKSRSKD
jgi:hypothetical protein